jgi:hypothetical protein
MIGDDQRTPPFFFPLAMYSRKEKLTIKSAKIECCLRISIARIQPNLKKKPPIFFTGFKKGSQIYIEPCFKTITFIFSL